MNPRSTAIAIGILAAGCMLVSCAGMRTAAEPTTVEKPDPKASFASKFSDLVKMPKLPKLPKLPEMSLPDFMPGDRVKVVEVREKDLRELPTGQEKALAYQRERKRGFWIFGGPVDFKEPDLPLPGSEVDGSLLPPRMSE
jgi:hypothetical protein